MELVNINPDMEIFSMRIYFFNKEDCWVSIIDILNILRESIDWRQNDHLVN